MTCWLCGFETTELVTNGKSSTCNNAHCRSCIAVADVDEEINQAVAALRHLLAKRCALRSEQNRVHGTLIHQLPIELKNYIFELLLPSRDKWGGMTAIGKRGRLTMPLCSTSICRSWRDIAQSNPLLWSTIHIGVANKMSTSNAHSRINFVHEWILRSGTMPLTLHIVVHEMKGFEEELKGVIDSIIQSSNRWHSLSLDMPPEALSAFPFNQCHPLKKLRIFSKRRMHQSVSFLNPEVSPEEIELTAITLHISWNRLTSVKVEWVSLEGIVHLFQHALQMTHCHISSPLSTRDFLMPSITHQRLKILGLCSVHHSGLGAMILGSLTLPHLQEFQTKDIDLMNPAFLPTLVERSSCPLRRITLSQIFQSRLDGFHLPGVTDLVLEYVYRGCEVERLFLPESFPDLRRLTLRLQPFLSLWRKLLDGNWLRPDTSNKGRRCSILVIDHDRGEEFDIVWKSQIGERLESSQWDIKLRDDGFELMIPEA